MSKTIIKDKPDHEIWCYGDIEEDSNFSVVCEDEFYDGIVPGLETKSGNAPTTWKQVIHLLKAQYNFGKNIEEVSTC